MKSTWIVGCLLVSCYTFSQEEINTVKQEMNTEPKTETVLPISKSEGSIEIRKKKKPMASSQKPIQKVAVEPKKQKQQKK